MAISIKLSFRAAPFGPANLASIVSALIAGLMLITPAHASSAGADITAPFRSNVAAHDGDAQPAQGNDQEFHQLFASWRSLDAGSYVAPTSNRLSPVAGSQSIPSRFPVDDFRMTSAFGMRWHPILGGRREHQGVDLADPVGTPVHATADGVVGRADWFSGYGLCVEIEHGGNLETRYGHMSRLAVVAGQLVHKGDVVGYVGSTGRTTGPHLHYEVRVNGVAVNPLPFMRDDANAATVNAAMMNASAVNSAPVSVASAAPASVLAVAAKNPTGPGFVAASSDQGDD